MAQLAQHVPRPFGWFLLFPGPPKAYADELRKQLWCIAYHLDWYLGPPRRLLRWHWLALLSMFALLAGGLIYQIISAFLSPPPASDKPLTAIEITYLSVLITLSMPSVLYTARVSIWIDELIAYLRRYATDES